MLQHPGGQVDLAYRLGKFYERLKGVEKDIARVKRVLIFCGMLAGMLLLNLPPEKSKKLGEIFLELLSTAL